MLEITPMYYLTVSLGQESKHFSAGSCGSESLVRLPSRFPLRNFSGGPVVKNSPANAGDTGAIPGLGTTTPHSMGQLSLFTTTTEPVPCSLCPTAREATAISLRTTTESSSLSLQLENACTQQQKPSTDKNKKKKIFNFFKVSARDAVIQRLDCGRICFQGHLHGCWQDQLLQGFWMEVFSSSLVVVQKPPSLPSQVALCIRTSPEEEPEAEYQDSRSCSLL